jgi:hypothetical protein
MMAVMARRIRAGYSCGRHENLESPIVDPGQSGPPHNPDEWARGDGSAGGASAEAGATPLLPSLAVATGGRGELVPLRRLRGVLEERQRAIRIHGSGRPHRVAPPLGPRGPARTAFLHRQPSAVIERRTGRLRVLQPAARGHLPADAGRRPSPVALRRGHGAHRQRRRPIPLGRQDSGFVTGHRHALGHGQCHVRHELLRPDRRRRPGARHQGGHGAGGGHGVTVVSCGGPETQDSRRTNFTAGLHVGRSFRPAFSAGAELRYQRWLTDAAPVRANRQARETVTFAFGPRFHFKLGKGKWVRPGLSLTLPLDEPLSGQRYRIIQVDVPVSF